jgi:hypothetical protein
MPQPREFDPSLPPPVWICPTCEKPMRVRSIEVANGEEHIKLACAPWARKPRKAASSPTSSSTYPPLRPPHIQ